MPELRRLADVVKEQTGIDYEHIMLMRHSDTEIKRLVKYGAADFDGLTEEFTAVQRVGSKYDFLKKGKPQIEVVAVVARKRLCALFRVLDVIARGTLYELCSAPFKTLNSQPHRNDRKFEPAIRFKLERIPCSADSCEITGWEGSRTRTATSRVGEGFFHEICVMLTDAQSPGTEVRASTVRMPLVTGVTPRPELLNAWIAAIRRDPRLFLIKPDLHSPEFSYANLTFALEHTRQFRSLVARWDRNQPEPPFPQGWETCKPSDQRKNWYRRKRLAPDDLAGAIDEFDAMWTVRQAQALFEQQVQKSLEQSTSARRQRMAEAPKFPRRVERMVTEFVRNPDVVAEVLVRADGKCERCIRTAPFLRRMDGTPYLEVHHTIYLADGGEDTVGNAEALCPNCHRRAHYG